MGTSFKPNPFDSLFTQQREGPGDDNPFNSLFGAEQGPAPNPFEQLGQLPQTPSEDMSLRERFDQIATDKQQRIAAFNAILDRDDISPQQRTRVEKLLAQEDESFFVNKVEEDRSDGENVARGIADAVLRFGLIGSADLAVATANLPLRAVSHALGGKGKTWLDPLRERTRTGMEAAHLLVDPEGKAGAIGQGVGIGASALLGGNPLAAGSRVAAYGKGLVSPWAVLNSAGYRALAARSPWAAKVVEVGTTAGATYGQRLLANMVGSGVIDVAAAVDIATGPGDFEEKMQNMALVMGLSGAAAAGASIPRARGVPRVSGDGEPPVTPSSGEPTTTKEAAAQALETARTSTASSKKTRSHEIVQSWNSMSPDQRRQMVPGLKDAEYELKFGEMGKVTRGTVRKALDELIPKPVDEAALSSESQELQARNQQLEAQLTDQVQKRRAESTAAREERRQLSIDSVTGIQSRTVFDAMMHRLGGNVPEGYGFVMLDVAGLKALNDSKGHAEGDLLLKLAGTALRGAAAEAQLNKRNIFRFGGDEFIIYGPREQIEKVAARAAHLFGDEPVPGTTKRNALTWGYGDDVITADKTMYANKAKRGEAYSRDSDLVTELETPTDAAPGLPESAPGSPTTAERPPADPSAPPESAARPGSNAEPSAAPVAEDPLDAQLKALKKRVAEEGIPPSVKTPNELTDEQLIGMIGRGQTAVMEGDQLYQFTREQITAEARLRLPGLIADLDNQQLIVEALADELGNTKLPSRRRAEVDRDLSTAISNRNILEYRIRDLQNHVRSEASLGRIPDAQGNPRVEPSTEAPPAATEPSSPEAPKPDATPEPAQATPEPVPTPTRAEGAPPSDQASTPTDRKKLIEKANREIDKSPIGQLWHSLTMPERTAVVDQTGIYPGRAGAKLSQLNPEERAKVGQWFAQTIGEEAPPNAVKRDISKNPTTGLWEARYLDADGNQIGRAYSAQSRNALREVMPNVARKPIAEIRREMTDKPTKGKKVKSALEQLDDREVELDKMVEEGKISEDEAGRLWTKEVGEPRAKLRKQQELAEAKSEDVEIRDVSVEDEIVLDQNKPPVFPEVGSEVEHLIQLKAAGKSMGGVEGLNMVEQADRGLRFKLGVDGFKDKGLVSHLKELEGMMLEAGEIERQTIGQRLSEVQAEVRRRQQMNPIDMIRNEQGSIPSTPTRRRLFGKPEPQRTEYDTKIRGRWVKGWGLSRKRDAIIDALRAPDQAFADVMYNLRRKLQNSNLPLIELRSLIFGGKPIESIKDPATWAQLYSGWATRADNYLFGKPFQWDEFGNIVESNLRGLRSIVQTVGEGDYDSFVNFLLARRALETGEMSGIPLTDANRSVANAKPTWHALADEITAYSNEILEYARRSGMISDKTYELVLELNKNYVPLKRVFEGEAVMSPVQQFVGPGAINRRRLGPGKAIHKLVGSTDQIMDPIQAIVENTRRLIKDSDMNRVGVTLLNAVEQDPAKFTGLIEIDRGKGQLSTKNKALFKKYREEMRRLVPSASDQDIAHMFDTLNREALGRKNDLLVVYRDGKRHQLRLRSDFADVFASMNPKHAEWYIQLLAMPTRVFKGGIVLNPMFSPLAAFKDAIEATIRSQYGFKPWDSLIGFGIAISDTPIPKMLGITPSQYLKEFKAGGGSFTALSGVEARTTRSAYNYVTKGRGVRSTVLHPVDALKRWARPFEEAARLGEFRRARLAGASVLESSVAARNVTVDFTQSGSTMQFLNSIIPFLNPAIQSITADGRALKNNPARVLAVGTGIALASWYLAAANADDQEINDLRRTPYGSLFWWIRLPDGTIGKLPKPYFYGQLFATGAERAFDEVVSNDPNAGKRWRDAVAQQVSFTVMPTMIQWAFAFHANKDPLTGAPLVPEGYSDERLEPRFQIMPRTSAPGQIIAGGINEVVDRLPLDNAEKAKLQVSPIGVDAMLSMALGSTGRDVKAVSRYIGKGKELAPQPVAADLPVVGRLFGRYPSNNVEPVYYFYSRADRTEQVASTIGKLIEHNKPWFEYFDENFKDYAMSAVYSGARSQIADIRESIRTIETLDGFSPEERRELIDAQMQMIIEIARSVNEIDRSLDLR